MKLMKECREDIGLTQQELADRLGLSQETISQYENGFRTPNVNVAKKIAEILEKPVEGIFFGKDISKRNDKAENISI